MTYIDLLNNFNQWLESNALPCSSQLMYFRLLNVFNRAGWPEYVQVDNLRMMIMTGVESTHAIVRARDKLVEAGFITFQKGKKGCPNRYYLKKQCKNVTVSVTENVTESDTVSVTENVTTNGTHIKTKNKTKNKNNTPKPPTTQETLFSLLPKYDFTDELSAKIADWVQYKQEKKDDYKEQGLKALLSVIQKNAQKYGDNAVIDLIEQSMSNGWKGIVWDKLTEKKTKNVTNYAPGERQLDADEVAAIHRMMSE